MTAIIPFKRCLLSADLWNTDLSSAEVIFQRIPKRTGLRQALSYNYKYCDYELTFRSTYRSLAMLSVVDLFSDLVKAPRELDLNYRDYHEHSEHIAM